MRVATDVGGTFTDYIIFDNDELTAYKALTTSPPSGGILIQLESQDIHEFSHGTTTAVNTILERTGAPVVFFTTKGFSDLVHIGRQARTNVYSFLCEKPVVPVKYTVEINERIASDGSVLTPISISELIEYAEKHSNLAKVAVVGFINSYTNPVHEVLAGKKLREIFPTVILSHEVRREIREFERFCTALMEGYTLPVVQGYLNNLKTVSEKFYIMQSNGGRTPLEHVRAVNMIMSGPAGGVAATQALCTRLGIENALAFDMGGTSADISAIVSGSPLYTDTQSITGIPIKSLVIDIESIGAGGGSIAWLDDGGALKVGPQSAGSQPGPACYEQGGKEFTVSDANLLGGVLGDKISEVTLDKESSLSAAEPLCKNLDMDHTRLSQGVLKIVNNNMLSALKRISIGRGYDPRVFSLVAFGGAEPMHACELADSVGIKKVIIPPFAGAFSAFGVLNAPVRFDYVRTILTPLDKAVELLPEVVKAFKSDLAGKLGGKVNDAVNTVSMDMRYHGQGHEINIQVGDELASAFHSKHAELFGFDMHEGSIEVVNVKMVAELHSVEIPLPKYSNNPADVKATREVFSQPEVPVYNKDFHGASVEGPSIIEDITTTVYIGSDWKAKLDEYDILHLERG
jgi:N-methylhydantoinase A